MFNLWWWSINCWAITIVSGQGVVHERILLRRRLAPQRGQDLGWDLLILGGILLFNFYDLRDIQTLTVRRTKQWNIIRCFIFKFCTGDKSIPGLVLIKSSPEIGTKFKFVNTNKSSKKSYSDRLEKDQSLWRVSGPNNQNHQMQIQMSYHESVHIQLCHTLCANAVSNDRFANDAQTNRN